jgi:hypothetical protein
MVIDVQMLKSQCGLSDSPLSQGTVSRSVVHISYQSRDLVRHQLWPQYWIHFLHPAWFGYHTGKTTSNDTSLLEETDSSADINGSADTPEARRELELKLWRAYQEEQAKFNALCPKPPKNGILTTTQYEAKMAAEKALVRYKTFIKKEHRRATEEVTQAASKSQIGPEESERWVREMKAQRLAQLEQRRTEKELQRNARRSQMELRKEFSK